MQKSRFLKTVRNKTQILHIFLTFLDDSCCALAMKSQRTGAGPRTTNLGSTGLVGILGIQQRLHVQ